MECFYGLFKFVSFNLCLNPRYKLNGTGIDVDPSLSVVEKVKQVSKALHRFQLGAKGLTVMPGDGDICSVEWGQNLALWLKFDNVSNVLNQNVQYLFLPCIVIWC